MDPILGEDLNAGVADVRHIEILMDISCYATDSLLCLMVDKSVSSLSYTLITPG